VRVDSRRISDTVFVLFVTTDAHAELIRKGFYGPALQLVALEVGAVAVGDGAGHA
jgi:hypothetical protein